MIDEIIRVKSNGNPTIAVTTRTKLILKGIQPNRFTPSSDDDPVIVAKLRTLAAELNVKL